MLTPLELSAFKSITADEVSSRGRLSSQLSTVRLIDQGAVTIDQQVIRLRDLDTKEEYVNALPLLVVAAAGLLIEGNRRHIRETLESVLATEQASPTVAKAALAALATPLLQTGAGMFWQVGPPAPDAPKKRTLTSVQLCTYADDNVTVNTTQATSDNGVTQTVLAKASEPDLVTPIFVSTNTEPVVLGAEPVTITLEPVIPVPVTPAPIAAEPEPKKLSKKEQTKADQKTDQPA